MAAINIDKFDKAVAAALEDYGHKVDQNIETGLDAAQKILIKNLRKNSPEGVTGDYKKSWKGKGKKYQKRRYVGNTKTVEGANSDTIPLSNILEYSSKSPYQGLIKRSYNASVDEMVAAIVAQLEKEV
ncbi:MAG: hypothetical protein GX808_04010 [Syntrophomonadaceae bacterium]|jgi:hypothetical protein|nr:hypothetical protein [Syntrophomonadaceae bacterium]